MTIYIMNGVLTYQRLLEKLGKHRTSISCLHINKLEDVDMNVLEELIRQSYEEMRIKYH